MAQDWTDNSYELGHVGQTDLANMENNFMTLKSIFSGAAAPGTVDACHPWFDTTQHVLKVRNDLDTAWIGIMHGDVNQKIWVYRNTAMSGWAVDSSITDRVISLKGGSYAYNVNGGNTAGSWYYSHNHKWYDNRGINADDKTYNSSGTSITFPRIAKYETSNWSALGAFHALTDAAAFPGFAPGDSYTDNDTLSTKRPAAAVGTLQYLDL